MRGVRRGFRRKPGSYGRGGTPLTPAGRPVLGHGGCSSTSAAESRPPSRAAATRRPARVPWERRDQRGSAAPPAGFAGQPRRLGCRRGARARGASARCYGCPRGRRTNGPQDRRAREGCSPERGTAGIRSVGGTPSPAAGQGGGRPFPGRPRQAGGRLSGIDAKFRRRRPRAARQGREPSSGCAGEGPPVRLLPRRRPEEPGLPGG
jgi:hypothetical protein